MYGISLSYTAVQDLEIWLFAWSYYSGINSSTSSTTLSENKKIAWKAFNIFMWFITGITTFFYCFYNYKSNSTTQTPNPFINQVQLGNKFWFAWSFILLACASLLILFSILSLQRTLKIINETRITMQNQNKTIGLNIAATVGHFGILIFLLITGMFEFYTSLKTSSKLNTWIFRTSTIQIILIALVDFMICSVFWILTNDFEKQSQKIRDSNNAGTEDCVESILSSTRSFHELMNRDTSNLLEDSIHPVVTINNTNLYYEMITNQFIKEYLEDS